MLSKPGRGAGFGKSLPATSAEITATVRRAVTVWWQIGGPLLDAWHETYGRNYANGSFGACICLMTDGFIFESRENISKNKYDFAHQIMNELEKHQMIWGRKK